MAPISGPERSAISEAATTNTAVTAILRASERRKKRSGDITSTTVQGKNLAGPYRIDRLRTRGGAQPSHAQFSRAVHAHFDGRPALDGLVDHAIALGQLEELVQLLLRRVGVEIERQADLREADRRVLGDAERAAKIEIALGRDPARLERNLECGRDR